MCTEACLYSKGGAFVSSGFLRRRGTHFYWDHLRLDVLSKGNFFVYFGPIQVPAHVDFTTEGFMV